MKDKQGREYLRLDQAKVGMKVLVDDGFACMEAWSKREVGLDEVGFFIPCKEGHHGLLGQADDGIHCVGIYPGEATQ